MIHNKFYISWKNSNKIREKKLRNRSNISNKNQEPNQLEKHNLKIKN
jgi:hypothetical protein